MGDKDKLEDLCINKKGIAVFQIIYINDDNKNRAMCSCTEIKNATKQEAKYITNLDLYPEKICPYLNTNFFYLKKAKSYLLGCDYRKRKVSDIADDKDCGGSCNSGDDYCEDCDDVTDIFDEEGDEKDLDNL